MDYSSQETRQLALGYTIKVELQMRDISCQKRRKWVDTAMSNTGHRMHPTHLYGSEPSLDLVFSWHLMLTKQTESITGLKGLAVCESGCTRFW